MNTEAAATFLAAHAPFDALEPELLTAVAAAAVLRRYAPGEDVLVEDGTPANCLYVVREGAIELVHQAEVIDVLEPGESFGHPSLLTGLAPTFTVRAHGDTACYAIPREQAMRVLSSTAGAGFVAATLRLRLVQAGHVVHGLPELGRIRVEELIAREPIFCGGGVTIRRAATTMTEHDSSAILVRDGDRLSILTDAVLRERVIAGDVSAENPVSRIVQPAVEVDSRRGAVDAIVDMLDAETDHVVVVDPSRRVLGVLSGADLAGLETRSPFALRHAILRARDEDELVTVAGRLRTLFLALLGAGVPPVDVARVLSLQADSITRRLIDLAVARLGPAPAPWAWLALGSTARRELTLASDQENALAYAAATGADVDEYFAALAAEVDRGLVRCGFAIDPNDVVARNPLWRMTDERWVETFRAVLDAPDDSHLIRANVAFDFRRTAGGLDVTAPLVTVLRSAREHPDFLRRLARTATDFKPPLGFRGSLQVGRTNGGERGLDLKQGGVIPIANLARFLAVSNGVTISGTLDRLAAVDELGALESEVVAALREAFEAVLRVRLEHHARALEAGREPDNMVDPDGLAPLMRAQLREAFRAVAAAQKRLAVYVPLGL